MLKTKSSGDCLPGFPNKKCQLCKEPWKIIHIQFGINHVCNLYSFKEK
jgi:hypothetical protein